MSINVQARRVSMRTQEIGPRTISQWPLRSARSLAPLPGMRQEDRGALRHAYPPNCHARAFFRASGEET